MPIQNIVSVSVSVSVSVEEDSTATLLVAIVLEKTENLQAVLADTGNEHE
jgi:hypothetical protein